MKADIHPEYVEATVRCSCGNTFTTRATKPEIVVELCANCHPFYTGKQKLVDSGGRVERFRRRYEGKPKPSALKRPPEDVQEAEAEPLPETKAEAEQEPQTADDVASEQASKADAAEQPTE